MKTIANLCRAAALFGACILTPFAWAAAPVGIESDVPMPKMAAAPANIYELDTEMVVHNWVLCVSQNVAEQLAEAREAGTAEALAAYAGLQHEKKCGRFAELRVILKTPIYKSAAGAGYDARVYGALVRLSDNWASAFVVAGGLPEN